MTKRTRTAAFKQRRAADTARWRARLQRGALPAITSNAMPTRLTCWSGSKGSIPTRPTIDRSWPMPSAAYCAAPSVHYYAKLLIRLGPIDGTKHLRALPERGRLPHRAHNRDLQIRGYHELRRICRRWDPCGRPPNASGSESIFVTWHKCKRIQPPASTEPCPHCRDLRLDAYCARSGKPPERHSGTQKPEPADALRYL